MTVDKHKDIYCVVGYPLAHSLSPAMHNAAFAARGVKALYLPFETDDIRFCTQAMRELGIKGASVTMPHKSSVLSLLDEVEGLAVAIGAVNTIVNRGDCLVGYNTDAYGALKALEEEVEVSGKTCLLVGAGGAARAIGFALREKGVSVTLCNRSAARGEALAASLGCTFVPLEEIRYQRADLLIQTTPVGMVPHTDECVVPAEVLRKGMAVLDMVYNPRETKLLRMARERECLTIDGLKMFVHQGAEQFRLWTGLPAPLTHMTAAVEGALGRGR